MRTCREAEQLRRFLPPATRRRLQNRLVAKYSSGRRSASDVREALQALKAQLHYAECDYLLTECFGVVAPVPTVLWTWACDNVHVLGSGTLRAMLAMAQPPAQTADPHAARYARHLAARRPDGLVALVLERAC